MIAAQKTRNFYLATANDLRTGDVVFFAGAGQWASSIAGARLAATAAEVAALEAVASGPDAEQTTAAAYVIEVERLPSGALRPVRRRERLRLSGPSIDLTVEIRPPASGQAEAVPQASQNRPVGPARKGQDHVSL